MSTAVLRVTAPSGGSVEHELGHGPLTVGRRSPDLAPDVVLGPDPDRWVGRSHCTLDRENGHWWVTDNGSVNGTLLRRDGRTIRLEHRQRVQHGDTVLILAAVDEGGEPVYWELLVLDPDETRSAVDHAADTDGTADTVYGVRYDWVSARIYRHDGDTGRLLDGLRPQGHRLIRYMVGRSDGSGDVACSHAELIRALWGDAADWPLGRTYTRGDLAGVVRATRRSIEADPSDPRLLRTVAGYGYRLAVYREHGCAA